MQMTYHAFYGNLINPQPKLNCHDIHEKAMCFLKKSILSWTLQEDFSEAL